MNKKLPVILAVLFVSFALYILIIMANVNRDNVPTTSQNVSQSSTISSADTDMITYENYDKLTVDSAFNAADSLFQIACGGTVSNTDLSLSKSAFNADFVPQEPEYVERFRNYSGDKATFVPVLMYHYFYDATKDKPTKGTNSHSIQSLEAQLKWLWQNDYVTLTMDELYAWMQGEIELPARCVLLTSDDGQANFFTLLQPVLKKYGFVATSFVITSKNKNIDKYFQLSNIEMHSHTHNMHRGNVKSGGKPDNRGMIQGVSIDAGVADMTKSSELLKGSKYMAYPYGTYGGNAQDVVKKAGFRLAFTTTTGVVRRNSNPYQLPRIRVSGSVGTKSFKYYLRYSSMLDSIKL